MSGIGGSHYTFESLGSTYRYVFPCRKEWSLVWVYSVLIPVTVLIAAPDLQQKQLDFTSGLFWLAYGVFILLFVGLVLSELLWQLVGKERVEISAEAFVVRHHILGFGPAKTFLPEKVNGIFVLPPATGFSASGGRRQLRWFNFQVGWVGLKSAVAPKGQSTTCRFGASLDEDEARRVVAQIITRFPQYKAKG